MINTIRSIQNKNAAFDHRRRLIDVFEIKLAVVNGNKFLVAFCFADNIPVFDTTQQFYDIVRI